MAVDIGKGPVFAISWQGQSGRTEVKTSRHPDRRTTWGLAMVRLAADAIGASVIPVTRREDGMSEGKLELLPDGERFTLPLASIDHAGRVERATRAFDEECATTPGQLLDGELLNLWQEVNGDGGISERGTFVARRTDKRTWLALKPRSTREQLRDVIAGIRHEGSLIGQDDYSLRLYGYANALGLAIGEPVEMWFRKDLDERLARTCQAFSVEKPVIIGGSRSAPPAPLVAFLTAEAGGGILRQDNEGWGFEPHSLSRPLIGRLAPTGVIPLT
jgi:hypothetical protein